MSDNDPWREWSQLRGMMGRPYSIFDHPGGYMEGRAAAGVLVAIVAVPVLICYGIYEGAKWLIETVPNELTAIPIGAALASTVAFSDKISWPKSAKITTAAAGTIIAAGLPSVMRIAEGSFPQAIAAHPVASLDVVATTLIGMGAYFHPKIMRKHKIKTAAAAAGLVLGTASIPAVNYLETLPQTITRQPIQSANAIAAVVADNIAFHPFAGDDRYANRAKPSAAQYSTKAADAIELTSGNHVLLAPCTDQDKVCEIAIYETAPHRAVFGVIAAKDVGLLVRQEVPAQTPRLAVQSDGQVFYDDSIGSAVIPSPVVSSPVPAPYVPNPTSSDAGSTTPDSSASTSSDTGAIASPDKVATPDNQTFRPPVSVYRPNYDHGDRVTGTLSQAIDVYPYYGNFSLAYVHVLNPINLSAGTTVTQDWCSAKDGFCEISLPDRSMALIDIRDDKYIQTADNSSGAASSSQPQPAPS